MPLPEQYQKLQTKQPPKRTVADIQRAGERTQQRIVLAGVLVAVIILVLVGLIVKYVAFDLELQ